MDTRTRFWTKVAKSPGDGCWLWTASTLPFGYGQFRLDGAPRRAHRVAWEWENGPIPEGMCLLHQCDEPRCVRPSHMAIGTRTENMEEMRARGREDRVGQARKTHCPAGHPYDALNTYRRREGNRGCKECRRAATRAWRARHLDVQQDAPLLVDVDRA